MAISLLVALVALGLLHVVPQLARWRGDGLFRRWVAQLADTSGGGRVALALLLPLILCMLLEWLLGRSPLGELLRLLFALAVLLYCFGPREFEADLEAILDAPDGASREAAAQAL
ncbi:beta-lactamase induction protein, partial [Rhodanobacter denitrificans]|nr:beta-lactamase induction protein [Rhodanobacter denitrificans]